VRLERPPFPVYREWRHLLIEEGYVVPMVGRVASRGSGQSCTKSETRKEKQAEAPRDDPAVAAACRRRSPFSDVGHPAARCSGGGRSLDAGPALRRLSGRGAGDGGSPVKLLLYPDAARAGTNEAARSDARKAVRHFLATHLSRAP
jgi:hypothetical protein